MGGRFTAAPFKKSTYSLDTGYSQCLNEEQEFNDTDDLASGLVDNSRVTRKCVLVYNNSGSAIAAGAALSWRTGKVLQEVQACSYGSRIIGFAPSVINGLITNTIPNLAYFWMVKEGPTKFISDGTTITNGDRVVASPVAAGQVRSDIPGDVLYSAVAASTAVTNTVTATVFDKSYSVPANSLQAGDVIRVTGQVIATATNSTDTLLIEVMVGTQAIIASAALDVANNDICVFSVDIVVRTIGATGTIVAAGTIVIGPPASATVKNASLPSTTLDTTAAQVVGVRATWSVANAGNSCRLDVLDIVKLTGTAGSGSHLTGGSCITTVTGASAQFRGYANAQW